MKMRKIMPHTGNKKVKNQNTNKLIVVKLNRWFAEFGLDPRKFFKSFSAFPSVFRDYNFLLRQNKKNDKSWSVRFTYPRLHEKLEQAGIAQPQYFYQDYFIARKIFLRSPSKHVDVGSSIEGFVAHVAIFRIIEAFDIRPLTSKITNIIFRQCDFMNPPGEFTNYCDSLSCLHALEHFGLGRYGDPINIDGYIKGFNGFSKVLSSGGTLYLSVPISKFERVEFNAHRVFSIQTILNLAKEDFDLVSFSYIDDKNNMFEDVASNAEAIDLNLELNYGLGIFEFKKH